MRGRFWGLWREPGDAPDELFAFLDGLGIEHSTMTHPPIFTVAEGRDWHDKIPGLHCKICF